MRRRTKIIVGSVVLVFIIGGIVIARRGSTDTTTETARAKRQTIRQEVEFTGRVAAARSADLGFPMSGVAREVRVKTGERVTEGQLLAILDTSTEATEVAKAAADRATAQDSTVVDITAAEKALALTRAENERLLAKYRQAVRDAKAELDQAKVVWEQSVRESGEESSTALTKYSLVVTAQSAYEASRKTLDQTIKTTEKTNAAAQAARDSARAKNGVLSFEALEAGARSRLQKGQLTAPFSGVITDNKMEQGEVVTAATAIMTIQTVDELEVVADVPESDSVKVTPGLPATVSVDALSSDATVSGEVRTISPAATLIEGVPTYQVKIGLATYPSTLRPGLSVTIRILISEKKDVITIPRRAIAERDGKEWVKIKDSNGTMTDREVTTGITGTDSTIEITSGLQEGEEIIVRTSSTN